MKTYTSISQMRDEIRGCKSSGKRVGFVPTMGALHEGHLSLARTLREYCDVRVCSIFVNPTQFNDPKDYKAYVINLDRDKALLEREGVDILFAPSVDEIYPHGFQTTVSVSEISRNPSRGPTSGAFRGGCHRCYNPLQLCEPGRCHFWREGFQQLRLIERMVEDLKLDIQILRGTLVRDTDGLALSSRNVRLSPEGRRNSLCISRGLFAAQDAFRNGEVSGRALEEIVANFVRSVPEATVDYIAVVNEKTLERVQVVSGASRLLVVVKLEGVRLLDNIALG